MHGSWLVTAVPSDGCAQPAAPADTAESLELMQPKERRKLASTCITHGEIQTDIPERILGKAGEMEDLVRLLIHVAPST